MARHPQAYVRTRITQLSNKFCHGRQPGCDSITHSRQGHYVCIIHHIRYRIIGPKRDEVGEECRKLESFMIVFLISIIRVIKKNEMGRTCSTNEREKNLTLGTGGKI